MEAYTSLKEAIEDLKKQGYSEDFRLKNDCIECSKGVYRLFPDEFHIDKVLRFDIDSDPADQAILYAISSDKQNVRGLLVNSYGTYHDELADEMVEKLKY